MPPVSKINCEEDVTNSRLFGDGAAASRRDEAVPQLSKVDLERLAAHHKLMWRIRAFEELALEGLRKKLVQGPIHPSIGQEAVAAGVCGNLADDDVLLSTHRGHGHTLAKGARPLAMMSELFGREGGSCEGRGGSMHIADFNVGMLGANGVVGANITIATGAAHAIRLRGEKRVACCMFGDGAINRGPFLEGLNWAAVFRLPVLFVCEDNGFAATTRTRSVTAGEGPSARARSIGLEALELDGNDVVAVDSAVRKIVEAIRNGAGPYFLHLRTYRLSGHTAADPAAYRSEEEVRRQWRCDPIARAAELLNKLGHGNTQRDREDAYEEMRETYVLASQAPFPAVVDAFRGVQDEGDPRKDAF